MNAIRRVAHDEVDGDRARPGEVILLQGRDVRARSAWILIAAMLTAALICVVAVVVRGVQDRQGEGDPRPLDVLPVPAPLTPIETPVPGEPVTPLPR
ncbi:hypothetical protein OKA04_24190 [Luteolibacter flavescens]|uniref:Uncharacterized protein n=1 Tax=Luteolibacter flavescens TaxID=1859460 RepID=A0ABT3FW99_9BACT|nr:hypothetical protein [Luteolibacter flavescens]MCW1887861.1 hypothetical protein [Luteolibacter flavescens]